MKIHKLVIILIALCFNKVNAQEQFVEQAKKIAAFPFKTLSGGVIMLNAQLEGYKDTLNFILDTGSGGISLDSATVDYFGIVPTPTDKTIAGIAGVRKVSFVYNQSLLLPGLKVDKLDFHINDYEILTAVYGEKIDGIIGYSFLSRYILFVNYDSSQIDVFTPGNIKYPRGGSLLEPYLQRLPVQPVRIKDNITSYSRVLFDMGAGLCLMLTKDFIEDSNFLHRKRKLYVKEAEGLGGKIDMHVTVVKEIKIGPYKFRQIPAYVFNDEYNITSYPYLAGILGNDLLRRFNLYLNYPKKEFYIIPNSHFTDKFDYSYTGVELYQVNGQVILGDVAEGSPAEQAGLKEGDIIVGMNKSIGSNLQQYKLMMQEAGSKVKMIISRNGELLEYEFKIKSIR